MPWIIAAAAVGSALLSSQAQAQSSGAAQRQSALQSAQASPGSGSFTPTASAAQRQSATSEQTGNPFFDASFNDANPPAASAQQSAQASTPPPAGATQGQSSVQQGALIGQALQDIFQQQQAQSNAGAMARSQALASQAPQGASMPFQATAGNFSPSPTMQDIRLQQLLG